MQGLLKDQIAVITGGTAGIGRAIALKFAQQGARVALFGTHEERGKEVVAEISQLRNESAVFYKVNVADKEEVDRGIKAVLDWGGRVDILVNNAGVTRDQLLMKMSEGEWDEVMAINVKSCYNTCHALVRSMIKARRGKIINMSSVVGLTGNAGQANYAASKAAIIGFSKALAKELAPRNISVNCIAPGFILTRMTEELPAQQKENILSQIPFARMGTAEEIADVAVFLASTMSAYITGQVLTVDGGLVL